MEAEHFYRKTGSEGKSANVSSSPRSSLVLSDPPFRTSARHLAYITSSSKLSTTRHHYLCTTLVKHAPQTKKDMLALLTRQLWQYSQWAWSVWWWIMTLWLWPFDVALKLVERMISLIERWSVQSYWTSLVTVTKERDRSCFNQQEHRR